jgi:hypothetical protein
LLGRGSHASAQTTNHHATKITNITNRGNATTKNDQRRRVYCLAVLQKKIDQIKLKAATAAWRKQTAAMKNPIMSHEQGHCTNILIVHADDM